MRSVLKNLVDGVSTAWVRVGQYWRVPCKSTFPEARQRVGPRVMSGAGDAPPPVSYFIRWCTPTATLATPGAFIGGLRVVVVDGTVLDVPDSVALFQSVWLSWDSPRQQSGLAQNTISAVD